MTTEVFGDHRARLKAGTEVKVNYSLNANPRSVLDFLGSLLLGLVTFLTLLLFLFGMYCFIPTSVCRNKNMFIKPAV